LTILDVASGQMYSQNLPVSIGTAEDIDSDGFINELEVALCTDTLNISSTPFGGAAAGVKQNIVLTKSMVKLNFAKQNLDSIQVSGLLPISAGFNVLNQKAVLFVGGVTKSFILDGKGNSPKGVNDSFGVRVKAKKEVV